MDYTQLFQEYKENGLHGRYISLKDILPLLDKIRQKHLVTIAGYSVENNPIHLIQAGSGLKKILMWSQMHGNESTTTKALFDFFNLLDSETGTRLLGEFTFYIFPMLNPDGAEKYTRENANGMDLNRDFQLFSQPESRLLQEIFDTIKPHYCYNLHDQRTIFGASDSGLPATVSFLAPAYNEAREMNETRLAAITVIAAMNDVLQTLIPGQVGRFDDGFNNNCVGDSFQSFGVPTVLFEAGHFKDDYPREETRKYIFIALLSGLQFILENDIVSNRIDDYLRIPQNKIVFYDFVYKNVKINYDGNEIITNFAAQYREELVEGKLFFMAYISEIGTLEGKFGHREFDANGMLYSDGQDDIPKLNQKANFSLGKNINFVNGLIKM